MKRKVGILTLQWANSYGGLLQCYALSTFLNDQGYACEVVNYWPNYAIRKRAGMLGVDAVVREFGDVAKKVASKGGIKNRLKPKNREKCAYLDRFRRDCIRLSEVVTDERQLKKQLQQYDCVIVGSDQVWNPRITGGRFDDAYFVNFDIRGKKIAYAGSTGIDIPEKLRGRFFQLLEGFDRISVRESSLSELLKGRGIPAMPVFDPVFLLDRQRWEAMAAPNPIGEDYILVYTLERNSALVKAANRLTGQTGLPLVVVGSRDLYRNVRKYVYADSVEVFLSLLRNARHVVTNSFHGTAFSLIFNRDCIVFPHSSKPARMVELMERVGLSDRLVRPGTDGAAEVGAPIADYRLVNERIGDAVDQSKRFLARALDEEAAPATHIDGRLCSGCSLCVNLCPRSAITLSFQDGFHRAVVDGTKCVDCGLCAKLCPMRGKTGQAPRGLYALKHRSDAVRAASSSGGFFTVLAEHVLKQDGVVYGVRSDAKSRSALLERFETAEGVASCRQSKYIQAHVGTALRDVGADLKSGRTVLFTGTPCQVEAVNAYLAARRIDRDRLITADIVCHGTPSPVVFERFVAYLEQRHGKPVADFLFRDKTQGWRGHGYRTVFADGTQVQNDYYSMAWNKLFTLSINDACFQCPFACPERVSDFTMGDFWGIEKSGCAGMEDRLGVSLVLCNTEKGAGLFDALRGEFDAMETSLDACKANNPLFRPTFKPPKYDDFWADLDGDFEGVARRYCYFDGVKKLKEAAKWFVLYRLRLKDVILKNRK